MKSTTQPKPTDYASEAGTLLLAEFIRVITRAGVVWSRTDDGDELAGFSAALDTRDTQLPPLEILVRPSGFFPGERKRFIAEVSWFADDDNDDPVAEMDAVIDAELYAEVEESWRASGSRAQVIAKVAVIRKGAPMTTRPYLERVR